MNNSSLTNRSWVSPAAAISFLALSVTGILMYFHIFSAGIKSLHIWIGFVFVAVGVVHLILNWRAFASLFRLKTAILATVATIALSAGLVLTAGSRSEQHGPQAGGHRPCTTDSQANPTQAQERPH